MNTFLIISGLTAIATALVLMFRPWRWCMVPAYAGMLLCCLGAPGVARWTLPVSWGITTLLAVALNKLLPQEVSGSRTGNGYIAGGALTGLAVGALTAPSWMVVGACAGAALGVLAFSRTPAGVILDFPSRKFMQYLCAKGLPAAVTVSVAGYGILIAVEAYAQ